MAHTHVVRTHTYFIEYSTGLLSEVQVHQVLETSSTISGGASFWKPTGTIWIIDIPLQLFCLPTVEAPKITSNSCMVAQQQLILIYALETQDFEFDHSSSFWFLYYFY